MWLLIEVFRVVPNPLWLVSLQEEIITQTCVHKDYVRTQKESKLREASEKNQTCWPLDLSCLTARTVRKYFFFSFFMWPGPWHLVLAALGKKYSGRVQLSIQDLTASVILNCFVKLCSKSGNPLELQKLRSNPKSGNPQLHTVSTGFHAPAA